MSISPSVTVSNDTQQNGRKMSSANVNGYETAKRFVAITQALEIQLIQLHNFSNCLLCDKYACS